MFSIINTIKDFWDALKNISFTSFINTISDVLSMFPAAFTIIVIAGLFLLCALAIKRVII